MNTQVTYSRPGHSRVQDTRPDTVSRETVGDVTMGPSDDELELPDSVQLASRQEMPDLGTSRVVRRLSSSRSPSDSVTLGLLQIPRALQPDRSSTGGGHALGMSEMTSPVNQGMTGSQVRNRDRPGATSRAPVLQQHSIDAAGGDAADHVVATSHGGQGRQRRFGLGPSSPCGHTFGQISW